MSTTPKTNAARILDRMKIPYELKTYEVDPEDLSAETVAAKVGLPLAEVFKTLVLRAADGSILMASIPAGTELDLKALAQAGGYKKGGDGSPKRSSAVNRIYPWGRFPGGNQKEIPIFSRRKCPDPRKNLCQRRVARVPDDAGSPGSVAGNRRKGRPDRPAGGINVVDDERAVCA